MNKGYDNNGNDNSIYTGVWPYNKLRKIRILQKLIIMPLKKWMGTTRMQNGYNDFYDKGGWRYFKWLEKRILQKRVIMPLKLTKGLKLLEIGCGMGHQSNIFSELGFKVVGVDISEGGIKYAKENYSTPKYLQMNAKDLALEFEPESFDIIFSHGMSWYHYELNGINQSGIDVPSCTKDLFQLLTKGGIFILTIWTEFSGRRPDGEIHHNELKDYVSLFERFGEIILISDRKGNVLKTDSDAKKSKRGIIIATRK